MGGSATLRMRLFSCNSEYAHLNGGPRSLTLTGAAFWGGADPCLAFFAFLPFAFCFGAAAFFATPEA